MQWLKPTQVAQVRFVEWTADGHLRHAAFLGLREDKKGEGSQSGRCEGARVRGGPRFEVRR
jgi:bifunctional non-homologous end joining protein LigD